MSVAISLGTALYHTGIRLAAPFVPKARKWMDGRKDLWRRLEQKSAALTGCVWMHCASVGEFEQGRPVLEAIKAERPELPVLITFFSPSGYEARKNFPLATHVEYLPPDSRANAERLLRTVKPKVTIFVKYEFWYQHLMALKRAAVPSFLVSAIFRPSQPFFRWYGGGHRAMLRTFTRVLVQDEASRILLSSIGVEDITVSGDTRFDRVAAIVKADERITTAQTFRDARSSTLLICGSTWPADETLIAEALNAKSDAPRAMVVPHELHPGHVSSISRTFPKPVATWSELENPAGSSTSASTCIVDRMGLLSKLYKYADITYVGGGFGSGIHNTLEAAAWGKPVIFGPNHQRFAEAQGLIDAGAGFAVRNADELRSVLDRLIKEPTALDRASRAAARYVAERCGATARVMDVVRGYL